MNERVLWRLVVAAPVLFGSISMVAAQDRISSKPERGRRVFEELEPLELAKISLASDESTYQLTEACVEQPNCAVQTPNCAVQTPTCAPPAATCCTTPNGCATEAACCDDSCCTFLIGTEATFLSVQGSGGRVSAWGTDVSIPRTFSEDESLDFDGMTFAPRIWLGVQGAEWGLMTRFWYLSDSDEEFRTFDQNGPSGIPGSYAFDRTKAYTVDWELTRACCWNESKLNFAIGGRYASLEAGGTAAVMGVANGGLDFFLSTATTDIDFEGTGVTTAIGGRTPIAECCGCIYLLYGVRGSVLWGDTSSSAQTTSTALDNSSAAGSIDSAIVSDNGSTMYIIETQLGAQWEHELACFPAAAFIKVAAEYQFWNVDGGGVDAFSTAFTPGGDTGAQASMNDFDLNLFGFTIGTGLTW